MVGIVISSVGIGQMTFVPWPEDYVNVETGDYITDSGKISALTEWRPVTNLNDGVRATFEYYVRNKSQYW